MQSKDIGDYITEFFEEADALVESLASSGEEKYINDWGAMREIRESMYLLRHLYVSYLGYNLLISKMETDKDKFEAQKMAKLDNHDSFEACLDNWIQRCRLTKFEDYRCIDFSKRFVDFLVAIQNALF